jgi:valyl-tRNA synthetase
MTTAMTLDKTYDPQSVQDQVWQMWETARASHAEPDDAGRPFVIVIPPPNVTAALHLGHALNNTLQDVLIRWRRMAGDNAVWLPGTDHAGIATQTVVEKRVLAEEGKRRTDFEREQFVEKIQAWKDEYEARITAQLKAMGCSCDWQRQAFTMDAIRARAVREAFFQLFRDELIYRGKRLVNWDPATQTALADDEVEMETIDGHFWYMKYPIVEQQGDQWVDTGEFATVATTRPETMLGDTAVAVNPDDPPRAKLIGRHCRLPIVNRIIPIVGDEYVVVPDAESDDVKAQFASGFLKVTPAHDPNDYEIGQRHDLPIVNVMAPDAVISKDHGWIDWEDTPRDPFCEHLLGMGRYEAREAIVTWFREHDLLAEVRPYQHSVGHSYRSHVPVEPYLSDQWYVKVTDERLAGAALRAMSVDQRSDSEGCVWKSGGSFEDSSSEPRAYEGQLRFTPSRYARTFQNWHENIRDWCISRQLWWGHRIPVWTAKWEIPTDTSASDSRQGIPLKLDCLTDEENGLIATQVRSDASIGGVVVAVCVPPAHASIEQKLEAAGFTQDPDVLDTWFSSALWPLSTLGWPEQTPELEAWNPTSVLSTAREIITLWVSRMVMFNCYFRRAVPFRDVFIHAMIQDGEGQKMSKSLGNGVDPLDIIDSHGADAMRFTLAKMTTHTQDVRMPVDLIDPHTGQTFEPTMITDRAGHRVAAPVQESPFAEGKKMVTSYGLASGSAKPTDEMPLARNTSSRFDEGRNFCNKLWNAARFALGVLESAGGDDGASGQADASTLADRWIISRLAATTATVNEALGNYAFNVYAQSLYDFFWGDLCDWYLEAIKPVARADSPEGCAARATLATCLDAALRMLHPATPFVTERLFQQLNQVWPSRGTSGVALPASDLCMTAHWPMLEPAAREKSAERDFALVQQVVTAIREMRNTYKVAPRQTMIASVQASDAQTAILQAARPVIETLATVTCEAIGADIERASDAAATVVGSVQVFLHGVIDSDAERQRLTKRLEELKRSAGALQGRLNNKGYVEKAPPHLVEQTRRQLAEVQQEMKTVEAGLHHLQ